MDITVIPAAMLGENCVVITAGREALVIDPGIGTADGVARALADGPWARATVLLTHGHLDHLWDAPTLARDLGASVHLHAADAVGLADPFAFLGEMGEALRGQLEAAGLAPDWRPPPAHPLEPRLERGELTVTIHHTPGHTRGSVMYLVDHAGQRLICGGDTVFAGSIGRTDLPGGDGATMAETLATRIRDLPADVRLVPGHGPETTLGVEYLTNPYLQAH